MKQKIPIKTDWSKCPSWMKEWSNAEDRASLLRHAGFNAEIIKVCNHFVIDMKKKVVLK